MNYEYVKGKGWCLTSPHHSYTFYWGDTKCTLESRRPQRDEYYIFHTVENFPKHFTVEGVPILHKFADDIILGKWTPDFHVHDKDHNFCNEGTYLTVTIHG